MGETCGTRWGSGEVHTGALWKQLRKRDHMEDLGEDGRIILKKYLKDMGWEGVDWTDLAQGRDKWSAFVNTVMNLQVP